MADFRVGQTDRFFPTRLHAKVSLGVILPLLVILGAFTAVGYRRQREATLSELSKLAAYTGRVVESDLRHQMIEADFAGLQGLLDTIGSQEEIRRLYLLNTDAQVIFAPFEKDVGLQFDNRAPECQPCHALPVEQRPDSIVVTTAGGEQVFRSMAPIENSAECAECHNSEERLIGLLLIDISAVPFTERLAEYLKQNLLLWISIVAITTLVVYLVVNRFVLQRLGPLLSAIGGMTRGTPASPLPEGPPDEIGQLVRAFNTMTDQVEARNKQNQELSEQLRHQSFQRGRLLKRLITAQEDERIRVARELHDGLGQSLTGLSLRAQALERHVETNDGQGRAILAQMRTLVTGTTDQMYDIIMDLRPSVLDDLGLVSALRAFVERTLEGSNLDLIIDDSCFHSRLPPEIETALFRAFQEGLTNVVRHAAASEVRITLACDDDRFEGTRVDDGRGFDLGAVQLNGHSGRGLGLLGMQERLAQCGGQIEIDTAPGQGTRVRFSVSLTEACHASED